MAEFRAAKLVFNPDEWIPAAERGRLMRLPSSVAIRDRDVSLHYEVEETPEGPRGVARLHIPEKLARTLVTEELPTLDRPLRFAVGRGQRGTVKADSLEAAQEELARPWMRSELERRPERRDGRDGRRDGGREDRRGGRDDDRRGPRPPYPKGRRRR